jgi:hypothetical protein
LPASERFVILGDLNADPADGDCRPAAIRGLLAHRRVQGDVAPRSVGGAEQAVRAGARGAPALHTGVWRSGSLRVDYVLPSRGLVVRGQEVFWPAAEDPLAVRLLGAVDAPIGSDHRLVFVDVEIQ